ncbi:MAG: type II toxin-antitoxin system VapC family toxin [Candidatus Aenigmarchaeota archaeon]|nr:type II toxin-antitoxin system VapC family toxin [Candidatus Aenigmarchaeota archaeon]
MILIDSNIWIFANIEEYPENSSARKLIINATKEQIAINAIILSEVFHKLSVLTNVEKAIKAIENIIDSDYVVYLPIEESTISKALYLTKKQLRINDAIIAQHAKDIRCKLLSDNAKDFNKIDGIKLLKFR